ncbi:MAG: glycosyltransferase family 39 protein [Caldilineaceae bacterium]|nr:glycosyltransferase family 39 protein [Caldilineaceae bacterium]
MNQNSSTMSPVRKGWDLVVRSGVILPLLYLLFLFWRAPYLDPHDWDYDEGINLMKTMLVSQGYPLYTEVWSDQPPLMTMTLAGLFTFTGPDVAAARIVIMVLSALLLWSVYLLARASGSTLAAILAVLVLVFSEFYIRLSGAVMIGLPALSLATLSMAVLVTGRLQWWRIGVAGILMALALQTKLMVGIVGPAAMVAILWDSRPPQERLRVTQRIARSAGFAGVTGAVFLLLALFFGALRFDLLLATHFSELTRNQEKFVAEAATFLPHFVEQQLAFLVVAAGGLVYALWKRQRTAVVPLFWLATTLAVFSDYRPLWYHHVILLNVPLAWLTVFGFDAFFAAVWTSLRWRPWPAALAGGAGLAGLAGVVLWIFFTYPQPLPERQFVQMNLYRPLYVPPVADQLAADAAENPGWIFTDHPFYAFQAGVPVPPPVAVISRKTLETDIIRQEQILEMLKTYEPAYVLLERFTYNYSPYVIDEIRAHYEMVLEAEPARYYRRIAEPAEQSATADLALRGAWAESERAPFP